MSFLNVSLDNSTFLGSFSGSSDEPSILSGGYDIPFPPDGKLFPGISPITSDDSWFNFDLLSIILKVLDGKPMDMDWLKPPPLMEKIKDTLPELPRAMTHQNFFVYMFARREPSQDGAAGSKPTSKRISQLCDIDEETALSIQMQEQLGFREGESDERIISRVASFYGFSDVEVSALIKEGKSVRDSILASMGINPSVREEILADYGIDVSARQQISENPLRQSLFVALAATSFEEAEAIERGAQAMGLEVNGLDRELTALTHLNNQQILQILADKDDAAKQAEALQYFISKDVKSFFQLVRNFALIEEKQKILSEEISKKIKVLQAEAAAQKDAAGGAIAAQLEELYKALKVVRGVTHANMLIKVYSHVATCIQQGEIFIDHPVFQKLLTDPKYKQMFRRLEDIYVKALIEKLPPEEQKSFYAELGKVEAEHYEHEKEALRKQREAHTEEKAALLKRIQRETSDADFESAARAEAQELRDRHLKEIRATKGAHAIGHQDARNAILKGMISYLKGLIS